jgi:hypothetical protein
MEEVRSEKSAAEIGGETSPAKPAGKKEEKRDKERRCEKWREVRRGS